MPRTMRAAKDQAAGTSAARTVRPRRSAQLKRLLRIDGSPEAAAAEARLHYVNDGTPGISRHPTKEDKVFTYRHPDGTTVRDAATLDRIRKLAIPPAYRDVWICGDADGHLQATGRDALGRRQYRYHPRWREVRDEAKFGHMTVFAKVLAAIVRLLETTLTRVGNEDYAQSNKSFGLTTLRNRNVRVRGKSITFDFRGKHGVTHHIDLEDARLACIVGKCQYLPGQELFRFIDDDDVTHAVGLSDVNRYLQEISGADITAKDFRTWAGTNLAALALQELGAAFLAHRLVQAVNHPEAEPQALAAQTKLKRTRTSSRAQRAPHINVAGPLEIASGA